MLMHSLGALAFPQLQGTASVGGGSGPSVECKTSKGADGKYKVDCSGANQDQLALRSEHILWLQGPAGEGTVLDIEIPNYKVQELIKAGFKTSAVEGPKINLLLKKPEQTYDAQVDVPKADAGVPTVKLQYEAVDKTVVHFPNDKAYSPLQGPILPPLAGEGVTSTNGRTSRQTVYSNNREIAAVHPNHRREHASLQ